MGRWGGVGRRIWPAVRTHFYVGLSLASRKVKQRGAQSGERERERKNLREREEHATHQTAQNRGATATGLKNSRRRTEDPRNKNTRAKAKEEKRRCYSPLLLPRTRATFATVTHQTPTIHPFWLWRRYRRSPAIGPDAASDDIEEEELETLPIGYSIRQPRGSCPFPTNPPTFKKGEGKKLPPQTSWRRRLPRREKETKI